MNSMIHIIVEVGQALATKSNLGSLTTLLLPDAQGEILKLSALYNPRKET